MSGFKAAQVQASLLSKASESTPRASLWMGALGLSLALLVIAAYSLLSKIDHARIQQREHELTFALRVWQQAQVSDDAALTRNLTLETTQSSRTLATEGAPGFEQAAAEWLAQLAQTQTQWREAASRVIGQLKIRAAASAVVPQSLLEYKPEQQGLTWRALAQFQATIDVWWEAEANRPDSLASDVMLSSAITQLQDDASRLFSFRSDAQAPVVFKPDAQSVWQWIRLNAWIEASAVTLALVTISLLLWQQSRHWRHWAKQFADPLRLLHRALNIAELKQDDFLDLLNQMQNELSENLDALNAGWLAITKEFEKMDAHVDLVQAQSSLPPVQDVDLPTLSSNHGPVALEQLRGAANVLQRVQIKLRSGDRSEWVFSELAILQQRVDDAVIAVEGQVQEIAAQIDSVRAIYLDAIAQSMQTPQYSPDDDWQRLCAHIKSYQHQLDRSTKSLQDVSRQLVLHTRVSDQQG